MTSSWWIIMLIPVASIVRKATADEFPMQCQCTCNHVGNPKMSYTASGNLMAKEGKIVPQEPSKNFVTIHSTTPTDDTITLHPATPIPLVVTTRPTPETSVKKMTPVGPLTNPTPPAVSPDVSSIPLDFLLSTLPGNYTHVDEVRQGSYETSIISKVPKRNSTNLSLPEKSQQKIVTSAPPAEIRSPPTYRVSTSTNQPVVKKIQALPSVPSPNSVIPTRRTINFDRHSIFSFQRKNILPRNLHENKISTTIAPTIKTTRVRVVSYAPKVEDHKVQTTSKPKPSDTHVGSRAWTANDQRNSFMRHRSHNIQSNANKPNPVTPQAHKFSVPVVSLFPKPQDRKVTMAAKPIVSTVHRNSHVLPQNIQRNSFRQHWSPHQHDKPKIFASAQSQLFTIPERKKPTIVVNTPSPTTAKPLHTTLAVRNAQNEAKSSIDLLTTLVDSLKTQGGGDTVALLLRKLMTADSQSSMDAMVKQLQQQVSQSRQPTQQLPVNTGMANTGGFPPPMFLGGWNIPDPTHPSEKQWTTTQPTTTEDWRFSLPSNGGWDIWPKPDTKPPVVNRMPSKTIWEHTSNPVLPAKKDEVKTGLSPSRKPAHIVIPADTNQKNSKTNNQQQTNSKKTATNKTTADDMMSLLQRLVGGGQMPSTNNMKITNSPPTGFGFQGHVPFQMGGMGWENPFM